MKRMNKNDTELFSLLLVIRPKVQGIAMKGQLTFFKRFIGFRMPVLLVVLESFAGIKPARSTGQL